MIGPKMERDRRRTTSTSNGLGHDSSEDVDLKGGETFTRKETTPASHEALLKRLWRSSSSNADMASQVCVVEVGSATVGKIAALLECMVASRLGAVSLGSNIEIRLFKDSCTVCMEATFCAP